MLERGELMAIIKLVVVIPHSSFAEFKEKKRLEAVDTMPNIHPSARAAIKAFIQTNTGYVNEPIACLSRFRGGPGTISNVKIDVREVLTTSPGTTLWELHMPDDMLVSVTHEDLMRISSAMHKETNPNMLELLSEDLQDLLHPGVIDGEEVISFIPFIDFSKCKAVAKIDNYWGMEDLNIGIEQVRLFGVNVF